MSRQPDMDKNPVKEVTKPGYYGRARQRAQRRKSPWNILLLPLVGGGVWLCASILWVVMWRVHVAIYPDHAGVTFKELVGGRTTFGFFLFFFPLLFASMPLGYMLANCIAWCIGPARKAFDSEARGFPGTSFRASQRGLWMIGKYVIPLCLLLSLIGALTMRTLK